MPSVSIISFTCPACVADDPAAGCEDENGNIPATVWAIDRDESGLYVGDCIHCKRKWTMDRSKSEARIYAAS